MNLTAPADAAKIATLKAWLNANAAGLNDEDAAVLLNAPDAGGYKVWRSSLGKHSLIEQTDVDNTAAVTSFALGGVTGSFIDRSVGERDGWREVFNSVLTCRPYLPVVRIAMFDIFSGAAAGSQQNRKHFWARGQRVCTVGEKLFVVATVGGPRHDATNGSNPAGQTGNRGAWTNPDTLGTNAAGDFLEGNVTVQNISEARNS